MLTVSSEKTTLHVRLLLAPTRSLSLYLCPLVSSLVSAHKIPVLVLIVLIGLN